MRRATTDSGAAGRTSDRRAGRAVEERRSRAGVDEILRFAALQLGADAETIHAYERRQQTVSDHQERIGEYLRLSTFDTAVGERLARFLEDEALRLDRTAPLRARARGWLRDEHVLAPADSVLRRVVGAARHKARALLTQRMAERLSPPMRDRFDDLVAVGDDQPYSPGAGPRRVLGADRIPRRSRRGGRAAESSPVGCVRPLPGRYR